MDTVFTKLKKVPAISKQELLIYIAGKGSPINLKIITTAGFVYYGLVVNVGNTKEEGVVLILQTVNEKSGAANGLLHIAVSNIESIEITNEKDAMVVFSLGKIAAAQEYTVSGKLDVNRAFKTFADTIAGTHGITVGMPEMELPTDGFALNRILKLTQTIQQAINDLLKEEDARESWKEKYNKLIFSNGDGLRVTGALPSITIHFPFNDVNTPEISVKDLTDKLMAVL